MPIHPIPIAHPYPIRPMHPADLKPRQRVLYIQQFNDDYSPMPEVVSGLTSVADVMAHFKPEVTVVLTDREEVPHIETFQFRQLEDFTPEGLIKQSLYLRVLQAHSGTETFLMLPYNIRLILAEIRSIEIVYRGVASFFTNARSNGNPAPDVEFMNVSSDILDSTDVINRSTIEHVTNLLQEGFNRYINLDIKYTLLLIPGCLANKRTRETWSKIADDHKMLLVTDWYTLDSIEETLAEFNREKHMTNESRYAHTLLTANQVMTRSPYVDYEEADPLYLPLSPALTGAILRNALPTPATGSIHGILVGADRLRFTPDPAELAQMEEAGLLTATMDAEHPMFCSATTLYRGPDEWLTTYSVVRGFDWLAQGLLYLLDRRSFENWSSRVEKELTLEIMEFLNTIQGLRRFLLRYDPPHFTVDPTQRDRLFLSINVRPHQASQAYTITFQGEANRDPETGLRAAWRH